MELVFVKEMKKEKDGNTYCRRDYTISNDKPCFKIGTVSYGPMSLEEFKAFVEAQQTALEVAEVLNRAFC